MALLPIEAFRISLPLLSCTRSEKISRLSTGYKRPNGPAIVCEPTVQGLWALIPDLVLLVRFVRISEDYVVS